MRVFVSHSSRDKPAVEPLARALRARGIEVWLDTWEIGPGDDIVAAINAGLEAAGCGIIVFSAHAQDSRWVEAEVSYLTYARIQEGKALIPVMLGTDAWVPPLLRPLARRGIDEVDAIAEAVLHRRAGPPPLRPAELGRTEEVLVRLCRHGDGGARVELRIGGQTHAEATLATLPRAVVEGQRAFLRGFRAGPHRDAAVHQRRTLEADLLALGRGLRALCLPGDGGEALIGLIDGTRPGTAGQGTTIEVGFEADDPDLLGLPFEALRLPDDRPLATQAAVVMTRRPAGLTTAQAPPLAGPLKILVAVGAPDEEQTASAVLDQERELQNILDAVEPAQRHENVEVRILEVGHPKLIGAALEADAYHVLHLSCHGLPGALELEDEDSRAVPVTAADLLEPLRRTGRPLPLVLLNACHGGVQAGETASLAVSLLRAGIPAVLAMQTSVSDFYAGRLAHAFYAHLAAGERPLASRALAAARKELEQERQNALGRGGSLAETQPEYATASLYCAGREGPLADFALDKQPLRVRPVLRVAGPVPQLRIDDLIGRRKELRATLRGLRDAAGGRAGVVLTGIGGIGKSTVAGRAMVRLAEDGWRLAALPGRFDVGAIARAIGAELIEADRPALRQRGERLIRSDLDDPVRLSLIAKTLAEERLVLVLDDFEQNLTAAGAAFHDPDVASYLDLLAGNARTGRLLITSRYPIPGAEAAFHRVPVGPLSDAESRKLVQRLDGLRGRAPAELGAVLRLIGGHPRMLEFLDGLLRGGEGRLPHVTRRLGELARAQGIELAAAGIDRMEDRLHEALLLGARDILLEELLDLAHAEGLADVLLQAAVSNLPITAAGLARALADGDAPPAAAAIDRAVHRLAAMSLLHRLDSGAVWVHRWTARGLAARDDEARHRARCNRAGRYRMWRIEHESDDLGDAIEAVRNFLDGGDHDSATGIARGCLAVFDRARQTIAVAALAGEVLERLPEHHADYGPIADAEAQAHLALGFTGRARMRYQQLLAIAERLAAAEPDRADYQRDLIVSHVKLAETAADTPAGRATAAQHYRAALAIAQTLAGGDRLAPTDRWMVAELEKRLAAMRVEPRKAKGSGGLRRRLWRR